MTRRCISSAVSTFPDEGNCLRSPPLKNGVSKVSLEDEIAGTVSETRLRNVKTASSAPPVCSSMIVLIPVRRTSRCRSVETTQTANCCIQIQSAVLPQYRYTFCCDFGAVRPRPHQHVEPTCRSNMSNATSRAKVKLSKV